ncbi:MAG: DUF418 domain-containing protein [Pseudomonadota bacterium]
MGILVLNIIDMAMPGYAYVDPHFYGGETGANWWEWAIAYVIADGKMRGLFTMMFGASTVLIAERARANWTNPAATHYARMATLFVFGMAHAYLIWSGDILVLYSVCGAIAFGAWRWRPRLLLATGVALLAFKLVNGISAYQQVDALRVAAARPSASADQVAAWRRYETSAAPSKDTIPAELAAHRGSYSAALVERIPTTVLMQTAVNREALFDTLGLMLIGMALFRTGFFSGSWQRRSYWLVAAPIPFLWLCYLPLVAWLQRTEFSPLTMIATEAIQLTLLRPFLSFGYAALVVLFVQSGRARGLTDRIVATGRMAFSNYLGTSILCTLIFNGYGLGWYGYLQRWQCLIVVAIVWLLMLAWSKPWLDWFAYGPFEWLWRSAARGQMQPFVRKRPIATPQ